MKLGLNLCINLRSKRGVKWGVNLCMKLPPGSAMNSSASVTPRTPRRFHSARSPLPAAH